MSGRPVAIGVILLVAALDAATPPAAVFHAPRDYAFHSPYAVVAGDLNGDGRSDAAFADLHQQSVGVLISSGEYRAYVVGEFPSALAVGDFNGDSHPDIAAAVYGTGQAALLLNDGTGGFGPAQHFAAGVEPTAIVVADFNNDRQADVAVGNRGARTVGVLVGNGDGTLQAARVVQLDQPVWTLVAGDFDGDGPVDLAVGVEQHIYFLGGRNDATFDAPIPSPLIVSIGPRALAAKDFVGDGHLDLAVAVGSHVNLMAGNGQGGFATLSSISSSFRVDGLALTDLNDDALVDLVTAGIDGAAVMLGRSDGSLAPESLVTLSRVLSVAVGDFNGDSHADLVGGGVRDNSPGGAIAIRYGRGDGTFFGAPTFGLVAAAHLFEITPGDFTGDGHVDLALGLERSTISAVLVAVGNGDGSFQAPVEVARPRSARVLVAGDVNGDSKVDLVASGFHKGFDVLLATNDGTFELMPLVPTAQTVHAMTTADLNHDGTLDLVADLFSGAAAYLGVGDGTFQPVMLLPDSGHSDGEGHAVADFDRDGHPDVALAGVDSLGSESGIYVLRGHGDGTFSPPVITPDPIFRESFYLDEGDFNGDGLPDVVTLALQRPDRPVRVFLGNGDGTFDPPTAYQAPFDTETMAVADVNGDSVLDIVVRAGTTLWIHGGNGDGTFTTQTIGFGALPRAFEFVVHDLNGDGRDDVAATGDIGSGSPFGALSLLFNATPPR